MRFCRISVVLVQVLLVAADFYGGKFYEFRNRTYAECVVKSHRTTYRYYGNQAKSADGVDCEHWDVVHNSWINLPAISRAQLQGVTLEEQLSHNKCRNLKLYVGHYYAPATKTGSPVNDKVIYGLQGPWCFSKQQGLMGVNLTPVKYLPMECFPECDEKNVSVQVQKANSGLGYTSPKLNYNRVLIDNVNALFADYVIGDNAYYSWKASDQDYSAGFVDLRYNVFLGCLGVLLLVICWIIGCYFLRRIALRSRLRRQRALQKLFGDKKGLSMADVRRRIEAEEDGDEDGENPPSK